VAGLSALRAALRRLTQLRPPWDADPDTDLRYRTVALGTVFTIASMIPYAALYAARGERFVALVHLAGLLPALAAWKLKDRPGGLAAAMHLLAADIFMVIAVSVHAEGGLVSGSAPWLSLVPAIFVLAGMPRGALVWLAVNGLYLCALLYLHSSGYRFPQAGDALALATRVTDIALLGITFCAFIVLLERGRRRAMRELAERNAELALAGEAVLAAARAKAQFLANISHEIRTPMNGVLGNAELLAATPLSTEQRRLLQAVHASGETMVALIDDVLDFSSLQAGDLRLHEAPFDPLGLVGQVVQRYRPTVIAKGLSLAFEPPADLPASVLGDAARLRQILANLLDNAVKFTVRGGVRVETWLAGESPDAVRIGFRVSDSGVGIAPEHLARLFEPFTQVDASSTRVHGGTGLGLAISRQLARRMSGELGVESEPGAGSRFSCVLAFRRDPNAPSARPSPLDAVPAPAGQVRGRVLLAEDNPVNQLVARQMLARLGYEVDVVANGELALEALARGHYALVLMDCQMPVMDGYDAARAVRERERAAGAARRTPILAVTANAMQGDRELCLQAGMDDYLSKPVTLERLEQAIARTLAGARSEHV